MRFCNFGSALDKELLHIESEVLEVRPSKTLSNRGLIKVQTTTLNQNNEPCRSKSLILSCRAGNRENADSDRECPLWVKS
jgi:hypothetical protein